MLLEGAAWNISGKSLDRGNPLVTNTYGTLRVNAYKLLEDALNLRDTKIYDTIHDADGDHRVLNKQETMLAQQAQESIREAFKQWIFKDLDRREDLCATYNRIFNAIRPREYDGSHIRFEGITFGSNSRARGRVAHFDGTASLLVHPIQIGLGVWNFRLNLKNVCTDGIRQIFGNFCGDTAGRKVGDKSFAHGNALPLDDFV